MGKGAIGHRGDLVEVVFPQRHVPFISSPFNFYSQTPIPGYQSHRYHPNALFIFSQFRDVMLNTQLPIQYYKHSISLHAKSLKKSQRGNKQGV